MRVNLKGVHTVKAKTRDGTKTYYYAWRGGPRLRGEPGTPSFVASYNEAVGSLKATDDGKFASIIASYKGSQDFLSLAPVTQKDYLRHIAKIEVKFGSLPIRSFKDPRLRGIFKDWRDELARTSKRQADYSYSVLSRLVSYGIDRGILDTNPCERGGRLYKAERQEKVWTDQDVHRFLEKAPVHLHLPLLLALWTGQRQSDLLRLPWSAYDGTHIRLRQSKGSRRVIIPVGAPLKAALDTEKAKRQGVTILLTTENKSWTRYGFSCSWRRACKKAEIEGLTFHDLRGSAATRLAEAGCTTEEIASMTGHSLEDVNDILDAHYLSRSQRLSDNALLKLENFPRTPPVKTPVKQSG